MTRKKLIEKVHKDFVSGKIDFGQALNLIKLDKQDLKNYVTPYDLPDDKCMEESMYEECWKRVAKAISS